jgi:CRP-like cAMP-binding protein
LKKGDTLFDEGEQPDCMYVLLEGTADVLVGDRVVESATKGALFGEMALVDTSPRALQRSLRPRLAGWQKSISAVSNSWCSKRRISLLM